MSEVVTVTTDGGPGLSDAEQARRQKVGVFMQRARDRFRTVVNLETPLRQRMLDDKKFAASEQWDERAIADRALDDRPRITINRIRQFIRQVTNQQRQANLSIKVLPADDAADLKTAEVFQGLVRHIESTSDAAVAYSTGADDQTTIGRGYWTIEAEYLDDRSFTQRLKIKRVRNSFAVYMGPHAEIDGSDANFSFELEDVPREEFITRYGADAAISLNEFDALGTDKTDWLPTGKVRIARYFYVEMAKETIHLIRWSPSGEEEVVTDQERQSLRQALVKVGSADPATAVDFQIRATREADVRRVKVALINGVTILEGNADKTAGADWPGKWIPVIPVIGDEIDINGELDLRGMTRDAKDVQRLLNWEKTMLAEALSLAPLSQWVMYEGQQQGHEKEWLEANRRRRPYLLVKPMTLDGNLAPLPQRITSEPPIQGIIAAIGQDENDLQAIMGLYQESLGERSSPDQSGRAIMALQQQGETANSNFQDNLSRAIRATGRILVDLIPHYYDVPQVVRILGTDETPKSIMVHANAPDAPDASALPDGVEGIYNLGAGRYDVVVSTGPGLPTRRKEAVESLMAFVQTYPAAFPILGDLIVKNMDWPGADAAAARLRKAVPAQYLDEQTDGVPPPIPPEVQQEMQQLQQLLQKTTAELAQAKSGIAAKQIDAAARTDIAATTTASNERIAEGNAATQLEIARAKIAGEADLLRMQSVIDRLDQFLGHVQDVRTKAIDHAHAVSTGAAQAALTPPPETPTPPGAAPPAE